MMSATGRYDEEKEEDGYYIQAGVASSTTRKARMGCPWTEDFSSKSKSMTAPFVLLLTEQQNNTR